MDWTEGELSFDPVIPEPGVEGGVHMEEGELGWQTVLQRPPPLSKWKTHTMDH